MNLSRPLPARFTPGVAALCAALLAVPALAQTPSKPQSKPHQHAHGKATCKGASPCRACSNCKYCKHCKSGGGTCGVCKSASKPKPVAKPEKVARR